MSDEQEGTHGSIIQTKLLSHLAHFTHAKAPNVISSADPSVHSFCAHPTDKGHHLHNRMCSSLFENVATNIILMGIILCLTNKKNTRQHHPTNLIICLVRFTHAEAPIVTSSADRSLSAFILCTLLTKVAICTIRCATLSSKM